MKKSYTVEKNWYSLKVHNYRYTYLMGLANRYHINWDVVSNGPKGHDWWVWFSKTIGCECGCDPMYIIHEAISISNY